MVLDPVVQARKGGVLWLAVALIIVVLWLSSTDLWVNFLVSWTVVGITWVAVKRVKHSLSTPDAIGAGLAMLVVTLILWGFGEGFLILNALLIERTQSYLLCISLSILIAGIVWFCLLSAVIPSVAGGSGVNLITHLFSSFKQMKSSNAVGPAMVLVGSIILAAVMFSYTSEAPVRIVMGLIIAYTQLRFLAIVDNPKPLKMNSQPSAMNTSNPNPVRTKARRLMLITIFSLHLFISLFYILLFGSFNGGESVISPYSSSWITGWNVVILYALSWGVGAYYALIAWLLGKVKWLYIPILILIGLACALVLGMIVGVYGMATMS